MKKINYDVNGNIYPYEIIKLTKDQCIKYFITDFGNEPIRKDNWNNLLKYNFDLEKILKYKHSQWIDGSFTTTKQLPNDIDVVTFINYLDLNNQLTNLFDMNSGKGYPKFMYNIDGYLVVEYPESSPAFQMTKIRYEYWKKWFGHDRNKNPKAIIEVIDDQ